METEMISLEVNGVAVGTIRILDGAISTIVKRTVLGIEGVARLSGSSLIDDFADLVRSKRMQDRSIQIEHKDDSIAITVAVNPYFGYKFPALIAEIQKKVSGAVFDMTGIKVASVSVDIKGIEERPAENEAADADTGKETE